MYTYVYIYIYKYTNYIWYVRIGLYRDKYVSILYIRFIK